MARPKKQGVDYFPLDVHPDNKIKFLKIKFGMIGYGTLISLYQHIYFYGYYCEWQTDDILLFSDEIKVELNLLNEIIEECLNRGIFSKDCYKCYKILTSSGIQKRYCEIVKRRAENEIIAKYLVNADNNLVNACNNSINDDKSTQIKQNKTETEIKQNKNINSDKSENMDLKESFELFRIAYPGIKRGLETEFTNFIKKHKDWRETISLLLPAIQKEIDCRKSYTDANEFYPQQKNLQTWLNQRCWEQELVFNEVIPKTESKPLTDIKFEDVEDYAIELIQNNDHIQKDNFNKSACRVELVNYFNYVKSKNIENWKSAIKTMFNKNVNKFIYA